ncbi:MAG TPA: SDR family oxidoreductase [Nitrospira sp.]|nr:SDR family oxidoreductase [Nitrospira sp.]
MSDRILVTGANGFVGSALSRRLRDAGMRVRGGVRDRSNIPVGGDSDGEGFEWTVLNDHSSEAAADLALHGVQAVIHLAARVHIMDDQAADPIREFRRVNTDWTERLARAAARRGVRRFVYMSSIKVNGEESQAPFTEQDAPNPQDPYGISKWEAERALAAVSSEMGLETVVVRSPLVYGPGVGGNFLQLLNALRRGIPLPFASVHNRRSLIYLGNLVDALACCAKDVRAAGQTYLVSDGEDLSTPDLIRRIGRAMGVSVRLWPIPLSLLRWTAQILGKKSMIDRLLGSLQVDSSKLRKELDWAPPYSGVQGLAETVAWFSGNRVRLSRAT